MGRKLRLTHKETNKNIINMRKIVLGWMFATMLCTLAFGSNRTVTDTLDNKKRVIELADTVINGQTVTDTLSITTYEGTAEGGTDTYAHHYSNGWEWNGLDLGGNTVEALVGVTAIVFIFGMPVLLIGLIFFFRYKNRKAKYRLVQQALECGQPLPESFFKNVETTDIRTKGIKNVFLGIGLFIFLWALTGEFGLGCIGLLIMFTGFGQLVIYYTQQPGSGQPFIHVEKDERNGYKHVRVGGIEVSNREKTGQEAGKADGEAE